MTESLCSSPNHQLDLERKRIQEGEKEKKIQSCSRKKMHQKDGPRAETCKMGVTSTGLLENSSQVGWSGICRSPAFSGMSS